ncbi:MAG: glycosyltransferase family 4 protein [Chloroflexi bacterium]|nr:glycosyltransferase family 4 protein [Chloroflexota bacterium]
MLIGIDASRAARPQRTGSETYALEVIRGLLALGAPHQYRLYLQEPPPAGLFDARAEMRVIGPPRLWTHLGLSAEMLRLPPDVLFVPAHVLPIAHPPRSVMTVHDLGYRYFPEAHSAAQRLYLDGSTRFAVHQARRLIAVSHATKDDLVKHYGADERRVAVVHHGVRARPPGGPGTAVAARYDLPQQYIIAVGTLQPRKNYARLIEAFASLNVPRRALALVIVGKTGWQAGALEAQARRAGVVLTGHLPDEDKWALLGGATLFALPSLYEGFGMPILEAQAAGVPVLTSSTSSCPEVAGEGALAVNPLDTEAIAQAISRLLDDAALRQALIAKGYENARRFSWERCARETLRVLTATLDD